MGKTKNLYIVIRGRNPGVYRQWKDCEKQILKFSGQKYKGFNTLGEGQKDAINYINSNKKDLEKYNINVDTLIKHEFREYFDSGYVTQDELNTNLEIRVNENLVKGLSLENNDLMDESLNKDETKIVKQTNKDRILFVDTETTDFFSEDERIIEIACVEYVNGQFETVFHKYLNPNRRINPKALKIHGITNEFLKDKPKFNEIVDEFLEIIDGCKLVFHNAKFDLAFINNELKLCNKKKIFLKNTICTKEMSSQRFGRSIKLSVLNKLLNLPNYDAHQAINDCKMCAQIYFKMNQIQDDLNRLKYVRINYEKQQNGILEVYTDGACVNNQNEQLRTSGIGIHYKNANDFQEFKSHLSDVSMYLEQEIEHTNNRAELTAILECVYLMNKIKFNNSIRIYTDSKYCLTMCSKYLKDSFFTKNNFNYNNRDIILKIFNEFDKFNHQIELFHVKGHNGDECNTIADYLASSAAEKGYQLRKTKQHEFKDKFWNLSIEEKQLIMK